MEDKIKEALRIIKDLGMPRAQQNERTALCLLALLNMHPSKSWKDAENPLIGITPMMEFARKLYKRKYAPNTRETFRRFSMHQLVEAGIALYNPDKPSRPVNSPKAVYQISSEVLHLLRSFKEYDYESLLVNYNEKRKSLSERYAAVREQQLIPVKIKQNIEIKISPGEHSELIKAIVEDFAARFIPGSILLYVGDTGEKWGYFDEELAKRLNIRLNEHGKMPDVILFHNEKNLLVLVESVTSHGPVDSKRFIELTRLFSDVKHHLVFVSAFPNKSIFSKYLSEIAWEIEVWIADNPSHMIHFNGDKFIEPRNR